jgi:hypothetical protein
MPGVPLGRGATGRAAAVLPPTPKGLLAMRGPGRGPAAAGPPGAVGAAGATGASAGAGAGGAGATSGSAIGAGATSTAGATDAAAFFAGAFFAGAGGASALCPAFGYASRSRRATGASTVEDAVFTYSPISVSFASTSLLVSPSSFASAETRALPAT